MGRISPPLYKLGEAMEVVNKISEIDEQINDLMIKRELYVKDLKQKIKTPVDLKD